MAPEAVTLKVVLAPLETNRSAGCWVMIGAVTIWYLLREETRDVFEAAETAMLPEEEPPAEEGEAA